MITAKSLFEHDKRQSSGGMTIDGRVYTDFDEIPEDVKKEYRKEAKRWQ